MTPIVLPARGKHPVIPSSVYVAPGAAVIGDVEIGEESSIWFGASVRGDCHYIRIGARTSIQDNSVLHVTHDTWPTLVGNDVTVGHACILHGCRIADRVLVGMGSCVIDDAEIASDVILGAGSLVTMGARIPSGVLALGRPAKVVRDLRPDEIERIRESARLYVGYRAEYLG
jgi:carbonic anhydrase/acetyltransferase-like protein (isoleucine patch superfamily)